MRNRSEPVFRKTPEMEFEIRLRGPGGEPVDLYRTFMSHGVADLPPGRVDESERTYTTTLAVSRGRPRTVRISQGRRGSARVEIEGRKLGERATGDLKGSVRRILNLDEDLSEFYALVADDPALSCGESRTHSVTRTPGRRRTCAATSPQSSRQGSRPNRAI